MKTAKAANFHLERMSLWMQPDVSHRDSDDQRSRALYLTTTYTPCCIKVSLQFVECFLSIIKATQSLKAADYNSKDFDC